tara:strand:- start:31 stop:822 length:792 start_codon:yes stop_codon:yes gene_type:complete
MKIIYKIRNFFLRLLNRFIIDKLLAAVYPFYFQKRDKNYNFNIFKKIGLTNNVLQFSHNEKKINNPKLSFHYDILFALGQKFRNKNINILEIGTYEGEFTNFLSNVFPDGNIFTLDLPLDDEKFKEDYGRADEKKLNEHLKLRNKNLSCDNIFFEEIDSLNLLSKFKEKKFDIIWIDGDHHAPQVQFDIFQAIKLSSLGTIILVDDIIKNNYSNKYTSGESFQTIEYLGRKNCLKTEYFLKRIFYSNLVLKKYISYSVVNKLI